MSWNQVYDPLGSALWSTALAALPIVVLLGGIGLLHLKAHVAALLGLVVALCVAVIGFGMPAPMAGATAVYGAAFGLLPIGWIILNVIFLYRLTERTGSSTSCATRSPASRRTGGCSSCSSRSRSAPSSRVRPASARRWR